MNFDYTYIIFAGAIIFEPMTILTNLFITFFCCFAFYRVNKIKTNLANKWAWFFFLIGISSFIGSVAHGAHFQLGETFLKTTVFLMNAVSLVAIYFCFKAANTYISLGKQSGKYATWAVLLWILILLVVTFIQNNFLLIKIHAGIVLTYSLIIHLITYKKAGSPLIAWGIIVSFFSIVVHSLYLSFSEWFNYKDIAHIIMLVSLLMMYRGVMIKLSSLKGS
ncbi:MAG: DUF6962 family protein [Bacteroidia bacterium]